MQNHHKGENEMFLIIELVMLFIKIMIFFYSMLFKLVCAWFKFLFRIASRTSAKSLLIALGVSLSVTVVGIIATMVMEHLGISELKNPDFYSKHIFISCMFWIDRMIIFCMIIRGFLFLTGSVGKEQKDYEGEYE